MWTEDLLYRGAPRDYIVHGISAALNHLRSLGLTDKRLEERLARVHNHVQNMLEVDLTPEARRLLALEVVTCKKKFGENVKYNVG